MQSTVALFMVQPLEEIQVICGFMGMVINHLAIWEAHINFPLVMSITVNKQGTFLLVSTNS
jgi:hypothetical protein